MASSPGTPDPMHEHYPCPGCSADMHFDPASGQMKCAFCGRAAPVPTTASTTTSPAVAGAAPAGLRCHPLDEFLARVQSAHLTTLSPQALEVHCAACGSSVTFQPPEVAGVCPFCASAIVAQPKAADPLLAPDAVLPAKISRPQAQSEVKQWLSSRWFAPNALKTMAHQEGINGVYLPFWSYDAETDSNYIGERGEHYYETEYYTDDKGNRCERQVQHTRWYPTSGKVYVPFRDVLIAASRSVQEQKLNGLQPWGLESLCAYEPAYLAGFKAQRYQVELPDGFTEAKQVMTAQIDQEVREDIGGDEQRVMSVDTTYSNVGFRHLLLPVWIGAYRFQNKAYQVVVNAATGHVQGERPYSAIKIAMLIIAIVFALIIFAMLSGGHH